MSIVTILIIAIAVTSIAGFNQPELIEKYKFNAYRIVHHKEYYRLVTHGFFHGGWGHLLINLFVLYSFGNAVIIYFNHTIYWNTNLLFLLFFLSALVVSGIYSLIKEKNNPYYSAIGASGAVSAAVFVTILYAPYNLIYLYFIPVPGIILGIGYLIYSKVMSDKNIDNVGHDAHFWGAVYGFFFPVFFNPELLVHFFKELISFNF
ncbi:MAG: rhomboid family intramembrane serine protease [Chlorobi bacterium]|nr:rhomboid family intramembrane serine protease [Chlorobiota bacterium]